MPTNHDSNAPERRHGTSGMGVDAHGGPVIDPTKNVLDLVEAAVKRLDDMTELRAALTSEKILRLEREQALIVTMADLRASHQKDLDTLESRRLDAMRSVDQLAVKTEADRSALAISALAAAAATTAETLRSAVNTSATNLATQLTNTVNAITERIASLEKSSYTGLGKQAVVDPQLTEMLAEMRSVRNAQAQGAGKSEGFDKSWGIVLAVIGALFMYFNYQTRTPPAPDPTLGAILSELKTSRATAAAAPQVIYMPSPPGTLLPSMPPAAAPR
jgi:hypothetical protein